MVHTKYTKKFLFTAVLLSAFSTAALAQDDPPTRVARLNYINGNVSMEPSGIDQWAPAVINRPFTVGDYLYADQSSVGELHMDNAVLRIGQLTNFGFVNLTDSVVQLKVTEGDMYFRVHNLNPSETFEVDTPNAAITLLRDGVYRIHVDPNASTTFVFARTGQAEVTGGGQAFTLNPGNSAALSGTDQLAYDIEGAPSPDDFDNWCAQRDAREAQMPSLRYLPPTLVGAEDLDDYGTWNQAPTYGAVWYPNSLPAGWAPYHSGHWAWIEPWGWTWVDDNPWGYAPFHYGRWVYEGNRWGWAPGPCARMDGWSGYSGPAFRPVYAPALVAFFGGSHWGVSLSFGGGGGGASLGWVSLGWGEVYTPSYHCSPRYFNNVNVNNTRIVSTTNITNVYNTVYVNKTVYNQTFVNVKSPNAVSAMPQTAFASGRPVAQAGAFVPRAQLAHFQPAQAAVIAPAVVPTREAVSPGLGRPAAKPPAQLMQRPVVARTAAPPQPASFAARQSYLQQHAGQPNDFAALRRATASQAPAAQPVHQVAKIQPVAVRPGQRVGNVPASATARVTPPQNGVRPNAPQTPAHEASNGQPAARGVPQNAAQNAAKPVHGAPPNPHQQTEPQRTNAAAHSTEKPEPNRRPEAQPATARPAEARPLEPRPAEAAKPATHGTPPPAQHAAAEHTAPQHPAAQRTEPAPHQQEHGTPPKNEKKTDKRSTEK